MDAGVTRKSGETEAHARLKRLALIWAQGQGFSACALEMRLPRCRYRADLAAYRPESNGSASTAVFECKQARCDLRRDNCCTSATRGRLESVGRRRQLLERHLRVHYPGLRIADSLFPEFDSHDFAAIGHRTYSRVLRELNALQRRLYGCTKFEKIARYRCANLLFLVIPHDLFDEAEVPLGWGALVEQNDALSLMRKPNWQETRKQDCLAFLQRIATTGTRTLNRQLGITFEEVISARSQSL
ncbi:MAG: hypothetical protein QOG67_1337 [Verrucomicrobiota bacterium]